MDRRRCGKDLGILFPSGRSEFHRRGYCKILIIMVTWFTGHILEIFGAVTGIVYVILEIRRNILLWPLGIVTSAVYIVVFGDNGFYAGMVLQGYYVIISVYGWYAWLRAQGSGLRAEWNCSVLFALCSVLLCPEQDSNLHIIADTSP